MSASASEQQASPLEFRNAKAAKEVLGPSTLRPLMENWFDNTTDTGKTSQGIRERLLAILGRGTRRAALRYETEYVVEELINTGQMTVAMANGKTIGMLGYKKHTGHLPSYPSREIFELCRASVLPAYQHRGVYPQLKASVLEQLFRDHPHALILSLTKQDAVKRDNIKRGYQPISAEDFLSARGCSAQEIAVWSAVTQEQWTQKGWEAFVLDRTQEA